MTSIYRTIHSSHTNYFPEITYDHSRNMADQKPPAPSTRSYTYSKESETQLLRKLVNQNKTDDHIDWKKI